MVNLAYVHNNEFHEGGIIIHGADSDSDADDEREPLNSDDLVEEILKYFEKGLKYMVPTDLFTYKVIKKERQGKMPLFFSLLQRVGDEKEQSYETFKQKLFEQVTHVLSKSVGVEQASDGKTYVYCT